jgi:diguanylate cyclase (GGDEF)-like protein
MQQNATLSPLRDEKGHVVYLCVSIEDTTDAVLYRERLEMAKKELETMSLTDALTDLPNRRHLMDTLECELSKHERYQRPLSLAIMDIDLFKNINDTYGHICGDQALSGLARIFPDHLRTYDFVARYGGEEFCVILANTRLEEAILVMERLRCAVEAARIQADGHTIALTISVGIASNEAAASVSMDRILGMADKALYRAKTQGRNRTESFTSSDSP